MSRKDMVQRFFFDRVQHKSRRTLPAPRFEHAVFVIADVTESLLPLAYQAHSRAKLAEYFPVLFPPPFCVCPSCGSGNPMHIMKNSLWLIMFAACHCTVSFLAEI